VSLAFALALIPLATRSAEIARGDLWGITRIDPGTGAGAVELVSELPLCNGTDLEGVRAPEPEDAAGLLAALGCLALFVRRSA
jgi:hypothetical protein